MEGLMSSLGAAVMTAVGSAVWNELGLAWGVDEDIGTLQRRLSTINAVLQEAETRAINDGALRKWLGDLKEVAFDAEDVLDELQTEAALLHGKKVKVLCCLCPYFTTLLPRNQTAHKIRDIVKRFADVAEDRKNFHLAEGATVTIQAEREEFSFQVEDAEIFGRDDDKEKVVEWLTKADDNKEVSVLPIVGLGGLGKTTLARMVYNDGRTVKHFEKRIWVSVGDDFDLKAIVKAILERDSEAQSVSTLEGLHGLIRGRVTNKRYPLILDDVWCEDRLKLERLKVMLRGSAHGSKIVVTTRSHIVATIMCTTESAHKLKGLTDDDCWMLFKRRAFGAGRAEESPNLVKIGKEIVRKCKGLPLAAKSLGGLMATKQEEGGWLAIRNSEFWNLDEGVEGILPALQLSYDHLSPQLKRCFTYCSVFPKDYQIKKLRLVQLWIAQGFIQSNGGMILEDIGTQYFNTLLNMSFFQGEKDDFGNIESCKMHDLVHDLSCFVAKDEFSIVKVDEKISFPQGCRYLSVIYREDLSIVEIASEANELRSFFLLLESDNIFWLKKHADIDDPKFSKVVSNLSRLRALHLDGISKDNIVSVLRELKHLRFLEMSRLKVEALPDSFTDLRNLQTLNLGECSVLKELPKSMMMMSNLRHLVMNGCFRLAGMPRGIGKLTNLQTLSVFMVGKEERHAGIAELRHLNQIKGELSIKGLGNVKDAKDAMEASLSSKSGLLSLQLHWGYDGEGLESSIDVLENLQPHPNMTCLSLSCYGGSRFPSWLTNLPSSLPNLVKLNLYNLSNCETLPPLGLLPSLRELRLCDMHGLKKVGEELYGESSSASVVPSFPSLKSLHLSNAENLEEWSVPDMGALPFLEVLNISGCPELKILSSRIGLREQRRRELDQQNQHSPSCMSLGGLEIIHCPSLAVLPEWLRCISALQSLTLGGCPAQMLPDGIQHLPALENLTITDCLNLQMLPDGIQHLSGLKQLTIRDCPDLQLLPDGIQRLPGLETLKIGNCRNLQMLPDAIQHLPGLKRLCIYSCADLQMLPDWIQRLPRLEILFIYGCPQLKGRCERETGEDWHKISHIPRVDFFPN